MLAHVLSGGVPLWASLALWLLAAAGAAFAIRTGTRRVRRVGVAVVVAGAGAALVLSALVPGPPRSPGYQLLLAAPVGGDAAVTSPVLLRLCAWYPSGLQAAVPGGNEVLSISVDRVERLTATAPTVALDVPAGRHLLGVQVLTSGHVVYSPPAVVEQAVTVSGTGPLPQAPPGPAQPPATPPARPSP